MLTKNQYACMVDQRFPKLADLSSKFFIVAHHPHYDLSLRFREFPERRAWVGSQLKWHCGA